tara:strand:+ start:653 stop:1528 length:876 start_codon:yes stop_codon:yes gene_type:complete
MGWSVGSNDSKSESVRSHIEGGTDDRIARCSGEAELLQECISNALSEDRMDQRAEANLNAQRQMAKWSFWVVAIAGLSFIVTSIGTIFLASQVWLTRKAVKDAGESTKAIVKANEIAEAAQRAWVGIEVNPIIFQTLDNAFRVELDVLFQNFGKSPATNVSIRLKLLWTKGENQDLARKWWEEIEPPDVEGRALILPGDTLKFPFWSYQARNFVPYAEGNARRYVVPLFVVSVLYQSSVTGDKWFRTDRAFSIARPRPDSRADVTFDEGVEYDLRGEDMFMEQVTFTNLGD